MKKTIRLSESELIGLIKRVLNEQEDRQSNPASPIIGKRVNLYTDKNQSTKTNYSPFKIINAKILNGKIFVTEIEDNKGTSLKKDSGIFFYDCLSSQKVFKKLPEVDTYYYNQNFAKYLSDYVCRKKQPIDFAMNTPTSNSDDFIS
jgi:hypothetical protein